MKVIHSDQPLTFSGHSIFLAGPTPRSASVPSWRIKALSLLEHFGYKGTVLVPERRDWGVKFDYVDQVEWEDEGLTRAEKLVFWVPREKNTMPALTTNVEFGRWLVERGDRIVYGRPENAENCRYLD